MGTRLCQPLSRSALIATSIIATLGLLYRALVSPTLPLRLPAHERLSPHLFSSSTPASRHLPCCVGHGDSAVCWARPARPFEMIFYSNSLGYRGTEVALYDYAAAFEEHACGRAHIAAPADAPDLSAEPKFLARFPDRVHILPVGADSIASLAVRVGAGAVYAIQPEASAPFSAPPGVPVCVHTVFDARRLPTPDACVAVVSDGVRRAVGVPVVPHIVADLEQLDPKDTLHDELHVPRDARVFCRHGGADTFNIIAARRALCTLARDDANVYVLLLGTDAASCERGIPNIIHVPRTTDVARKARFLATCNACVHGRADGETFSLSLAECSKAGLPAFTYAHPPSDAAFHLTLLGTGAKLYEGKLDLLAGMRALDVAEERRRAGEYRERVAQYSSVAVMGTFLDAFNLLGAVSRGRGEKM